MLRKTKLFFRLPLNRKFLLLEALGCLLLVRPLASMHIKVWTHLLGYVDQESPREIDHDVVLPIVMRIRWAIEVVRRYTPWRADCLPQALAATLMLQRRHIPSTFYLGVSFEEQKNSLSAHAWVRVGPIIVTGFESYSQFRVITRFGTKTL